MPDDPDPVAGAGDPLGRAPDRPQGGRAQDEGVDVDDGLVAERQGLETGRDERPGGLLPRPDDRRVPAVGPGLGQPGRDRGTPVLRRPDRVTGGQADRRDDAMGDGGAVVGGEHHRLVAAGGEVPQRVARSRRAQQQPDVELVLGGHEALDPLRPEERHRGQDQGRARDEADDGGDPVRAPVDHPGGVHPAAVDTAHHAQRPQGALGSAAQGAMEHPGQAEGDGQGESAATGEDQRGRAPRRGIEPGREGRPQRQEEGDQEDGRNGADREVDAVAGREVRQQRAGAGAGADADGDGAVGQRERLEGHQAPQRHAQATADDPGEQDQQRHVDEVRADGEVDGPEDLLPVVAPGATEGDGQHRPERGEGDDRSHTASCPVPDGGRRAPATSAGTGGRRSACVHVNGHAVATPLARPPPAPPLSSAGEPTGAIGAVIRRTGDAGRRGPGRAATPRRRAPRCAAPPPRRAGTGPTSR